MIELTISLGINVVVPMQRQLIRLLIKLVDIFLSQRQINALTQSLPILTKILILLRLPCPPLTLRPLTLLILAAPLPHLLRVNLIIRIGSTVPPASLALSSPACSPCSPAAALVTLPLLLPLPPLPLPCRRRLLPPHRRAVFRPLRGYFALLGVLGAGLDGALEFRALGRGFPFEEVFVGALLAAALGLGEVFHGGRSGKGGGILK